MNHLYYGDNLKVLRESIPGASVDLIYLGPPFNSNARYLRRKCQNNPTLAKRLGQN
jgi:16S rRNA G966 N2-methylase RsmD